MCLFDMWIISSWKQSRPKRLGKTFCYFSPLLPKRTEGTYSVSRGPYRPRKHLFTKNAHFHLRVNCLLPSWSSNPLPQHPFIFSWRWDLREGLGHSVEWLSLPGAELRMRDVNLAWDSLLLTCLRSISFLDQPEPRKFFLLNKIKMFHKCQGTIWMSLTARLLLLADETPSS